tara:strand:- start:2718 stop:3302 length:585 start_codon:yes stop_codon:yes gene_type:complete
MSNLFQTLELEAFKKGINPRTAESRDWFRKKATQLGRINRNTLMQDKDVNLQNRFGAGSMFMYFYDPKHKETLPYYDRFPLTIVTERAPGGFMGLNLHYLPPVLRAKFLDSLLDITSNKKYNEQTKFNLSMRTLKAASKFKYFKPCLKHYLSQHVRSRFAKVQATEWEIAVFLPVQDFAKRNATYVYSESRKAI